MAELADAADSKSAEVHPSWGFDPPSRHQPTSQKWVLSISLDFLRKGVGRLEIFDCTQIVPKLWFLALLFLSLCTTFTTYSVFVVFVLTRSRGHVLVVDDWVAVKDAGGFPAADLLDHRFGNSCVS